MRMLTGLALLGVGAVLQLGTAARAENTVPPYIAAAVANSTRPDAERQADGSRKPAQVLAFAGVKPGDKIIELMNGGGYFTRIFCSIAGDTGHVYAVNPDLPNMPKKPPSPDAPPPPSCSNLTTLTQPMDKLALPEKADLIWTSQNYHDLHNAMLGKPDMLAVDKSWFNALKPGGLLIIEDHAAASGTGTGDTDTLHRIDEAAVKQEVLAAGFVYVGESDVLRNPNDPHTAKVFDPSIRGKTDQFVIKFKKP